MRPNGRFRSLISELENGTLIKVQGAFGNFTIDPEFDRQIVMIASGIGITPFISQIRQAKISGLINPIVLLYSTNSAQDIPFYEELMQLHKTMPNFKVFFLIRHGNNYLDKRIYARRLNLDVVSQIVSNNFINFSYFICGSTKFNKQLSKQLKSQLVPVDQIVTESFTQGSESKLFGIKLSIPTMTYAATSMAMLAGFFLIMAVDLVRYVPHAQAKASSSISSTNSSTPSLSSYTNANNISPTNSSSTSIPTSTPSTNSSSSSTNSSSSPTSSSTNTQTYSAPISSVS